MPPVPTACQQLADGVASLKQQYEAAAARAAAASGAEAWTDLTEAGTLLAELTQAEADLAQCVETHSAALTGTVTVIDATGDAPIGAQSATLWDLTGPGPAAAGVAPVQAGAFGFQGPIPAAAAITLQSTGGADGATGLDFRSGPLTTPVASQTPRVELVICPATRIPVAALQKWAAAFTPVSQQLNAPVGSPLGPVQATVNAVGITLAGGAATVSASGSISGTVLQTPFPPLPASASVSLALAPSVSLQTDELVVIALAGSNPVSVQTSSPLLTAVAGVVSGLLGGFVANLVRSELSDLVHELLPAAVARSLALAELPQLTTISLRDTAIDETGITCQPAIGAIGTTLSTFTPTPLAAP